MIKNEYRDNHNDCIDPYEEMVSEHERVTLHNPKEDMVFCEQCSIIFKIMVEDGQICKNHPTSYFEPRTKTKREYCEGCEFEEFF